MDCNVSKISKVKISSKSSFWPGISHTIFYYGNVFNGRI